MVGATLTTLKKMAAALNLRITLDSVHRETRETPLKRTPFGHGLVTENSARGHIRQHQTTQRSLQNVL